MVYADTAEKEAAFTMCMISNTPDRNTTPVTPSNKDSKLSIHLLISTFAVSSHFTCNRVRPQLCQEAPKE